MAFRYYGRVGVIIIGAIILLFAAIPGLRFFNSWRAERALKRFEHELMRPYTEDTIGGTTPEETFQMFLEALKKEDVDLAVKYFVHDKQEEWRINLERAKADGNLTQLTEEWISAVRVWKKDVENSSETVTTYWYNIAVGVRTVEIQGREFSLQAGEETQIASFTRQSNGVWKIRSL